MSLDCVKIVVGVSIGVVEVIGDVVGVIVRKQLVENIRSRRWFTNSI